MPSFIHADIAQNIELRYKKDLQRLSRCSGLISIVVVRVVGVQRKLYNLLRKQVSFIPVSHGHTTIIGLSREYSEKPQENRNSSKIANPQRWVRLARSGRAWDQCLCILRYQYHSN